MKKAPHIMYLLLGFMLTNIQCFDYLGSRSSLNLEKQNINDFFKRNNFDITVAKTSNVSGSRVFLHDFTANEADIERMVQILEFEIVSENDFTNIHSAEFANFDDQIHCTWASDYLKNNAIQFFKGKDNNTKSSAELKANKIFLFYDKTTRKACFQTFYNWG